MTVLWVVLGVIAGLFALFAAFVSGMVAVAMASSRRYHELQARHEELQGEFDDLIDDMVGMEKLDKAKARQARDQGLPPG